MFELKEQDAASKLSGCLRCEPMREANWNFMQNKHNIVLF